MSDPDDTLPRYTPDKLKTIRNDELRLTQDELAERAGCDTKTLQRYESGVSRIPPGFIRKVEQCRVEDFERHAQMVAADKIDTSNVKMEPGLELVPLVPARKLLGSITPFFAAVSKAMIPKTGSGGGSASPAPASGSGQSHGAREARRERVEFGMIMAGIGSVALLCFAILGVVFMLYRELQLGTRWTRGLRVARDAKIDRPAPPPPERAPDETGAQEPDALSDEVLSNSPSDESADTGAKPKRSFKMPDKPYSWQKTGPCDPGEHEKVGGCWGRLAPDDFRPPCPSYAVESGNECFVPIPAKPKKPNTVEPKK